MSLNFPASPELNQAYTYEGRTWRWNGTAWKIDVNLAGTGYTGSRGDTGYVGSEGESTFTWSTTPPSNPDVGDRWYDTEQGILVVYVDDGNTQQWVEVSANGFQGQTGYTGSAGNLFVPGGISANVAGQFLINDGVQSSWASGAPTLRNRIINGDFDIWQRGTSTTSSGYLADRWISANTGSTKTASRQIFDLGQLDVPNNPTYYFRTVVTSVEGVDNYVNLIQRIESVATFAGKTATLSFWAKADASRSVGVSFVQNFGTGGSPSDPVTFGATKFDITSSWTKYTLTVAVPPLYDIGSQTRKVIGTSANDHLAVRIFFDAGSNLNDDSASVGHQSGTFDIAQVQFEEGSVATVFELRPLGFEQDLCLRYYQRFSSDGRSNAAFYNIVARTTTAYYGTFSYYRKRTAPTITVSNALHFTSSGIVATTFSYGEITKDSSLASGSCNTTTVGYGGVVRGNATTSAYIEVDSEL